MSLVYDGPIPSAVIAEILKYRSREDDETAAIVLVSRL